MSPASRALRRAIPLLRCPLCGEPLTAVEVESAGPGTPGPVTGVRCDSGHAFDRARQGQLTLFGLRGRRFVGDTADQVLSRERVLVSGVLDPLATRLGRVAGEAIGRADREDRGAGPVVLEAGAGTGFYLERVLSTLRGDRGGDDSGGDHSGGAGRGGEGDAAAPLGIGTEISVAAARRLARADADIAALVADTWDGLPVADDSVDVVQVVFAPRNAAEFARVLAPGGVLVVAGPGPGHLEPLRSHAGMLTPEAGKADRLEAGLAGYFAPGAAHVVDFPAQVPGSVAVDLALMGPSGVHLDRGGLEQRLGGGDREVRVHVEVRTFHPVRSAQ